MKKLKNIFLFYVTISIFVGLYKLSQPDYDRARRSPTLPYIYDCTRLALGIVAGALNNSSSNWFRGIAIVFSPVAVAGLPACVIADTLMLPYDYYKYLKVGPHVKFWLRAESKDIQISNGIVMNAEEFREHYSPLVAKLVVSRINLAKFHNNPDVAELLLALAESSPDIRDSRGIITKLGESDHLNEHSMIRICDMVLEDPQRHYSLTIRLARSDNAPEECLKRYLSEDIKLRSIVDHKKVIEPKYSAASNKNLNTEFLDKTVNSAMESSDYKLLSSVARNGSTADSTINNIIQWLRRNHEDKTNADRIGLFNNLAERGNNEKDVRFIYQSLQDEEALIRLAENASTSKASLIEIIKDHPDKKRLLVAVASGNRVDFDVYQAFMQHTQEKHLGYVSAALVSNSNLQDNTILADLASRNETQNIVSSYTYRRLLERSEVPTIELMDYGILEFVQAETNLPESLFKEAGWRRPGSWVVKERTNTIPNAEGVNFGVMYKAATKYSTKSVNIKHKIIYPNGGISDPETGKTMLTDTSEDRVNPNEGYIYYEVIEDPMKTKTGKWVIQILHEGNIVVEKAFYIKDPASLQQKS